MIIPEIFQQDDDDTTAKKALATIDTVNVCRFVNGTRESIPRKYAITELANLEQLYAELGAGSYELFGRDQKSQIVKRVKVVVANPPGYVPPQQPIQPMQLQQPVQVQGGGGDNQVLVAIISLMGQQMNMTGQMMSTMMQMNGTNSREHVQAMGQMFNGFATAQTSLLEKVMSQSGGKDPQDAFLKGIETATELRRGMAEENAGSSDDSGGGLAETVQAVAQGIGLAQSVGLIPGGMAQPPPIAAS